VLRILRTKLSRLLLAKLTSRSMPCALKVSSPLCNAAEPLESSEAPAWS